MRYLLTSWLDFLLIFVPVTVVLEVLRADPLLVFVSAGLAIIPLAGLLAPPSSMLHAGRHMPPWGESEGGLRPEEIRSVVAQLRVLGGTAFQPDGRPRRWARGDAAAGQALYAAACAGCHGARGEGKEGPALANPVLLRAASDGYLFRTVALGRRGTQMEGFASPSTVRRALSDAEIESIVTFLRTWEKKP